MKSRVNILSNKPLVRAGLFYVLNDHFELVNFDDESDVIIIDDIDNAIPLQKKFPTARIIALGEENEPTANWLRKLVGQDVSAYVRPGACSDTLIKTIELVALGESVWPMSVAKLMRKPDITEAPVPATVNSVATRQALTKCELLVLAHLKDGASNKIIANRIRIADATVKVHVKSILKKLNVTNRTQAALWANDYLHNVTPMVDPTILPVEEAPREVA